MNKLTIIFGIILCLVVVNARHFAEERSDVESQNNEETRKGHYLQPRHRRRRWQMNYGYDYPPPYYPDRRDSYDRNNQELIQNIYRLLEEISSTLRTRQAPPPPPQPIYIPYPVPYFIPQGSCDKKQEKMPNITTRFPAMEDTNQNWGFVPEEDSDDGDDDLGDGARPISLDPIAPKQYMKRPSPPVEHGSHQASQSDETPKKGVSSFAAESSSSSSAPGMCNAAVLSCCFSNDKLQQKQCFSNIGCSVSYDNGRACNPDSVQRALDSFRAAYSPKN